MEKNILEKGKELNKMSLSEMDEYWEMVKKNETE